MADAVTQSGDKAARHLARHRHKYSLLRRQYTMTALCQGEVLRPWMKALALWYVAQVKTPKPPEVFQYAKGLVNGQPISQAAINKLISNPAFQAAVQQYEEETTSRAKAYAESKLNRAIEHHFDAIEYLATEKKYETLVKYTNPLMERVWPTSEGPRAPAQIVQIVIGGQFAQAHLRETKPVEFEVIEEPKAEVVAA